MDSAAVSSCVQLRRGLTVWALACLQVCFEVFISEHLAVDFGEDHQELDPHIVRIGWSTDSHNFQLGNVLTTPPFYLSSYSSSFPWVSTVLNMFYP